MIEKINNYVIQSAVLRLQLPLLFKQRKYKELLPLTGKQPSRGLQDGEMLLRGSGPKRSPRKSPRSRGGLRPQALRDPRESCPDAKQNWTASGKLETLRSLRP